MGISRSFINQKSKPLTRSKSTNKQKKMKLKTERISGPTLFNTVTYKEGFRPKPWQEIKPENIERTYKNTEYSYQGASKLFDVWIHEDGKRTYWTNSRPSEKTATHAALEKHFNH